MRSLFLGLLFCLVLFFEAGFLFPSIKDLCTMHVVIEECHVLSLKIKTQDPTCHFMLFNCFCFDLFSSLAGR